MDEHASIVVGVGASAGGVDALTTLAAGLPADLQAAVCVVLHLPAGAESRLAEILARAGPLSAVQARDGEQLSPSRIYVAPPDRHLIVRGGHTVARSARAAVASSRKNPPTLSSRRCRCRRSHATIRTAYCPSQRSQQR